MVMAWPRNTHIRPTADPAVQFVLAKLPGSKSVMVAECAAGLGTDTIRMWRYHGSPRMDTLRRALNAVGYDLAVVDISTGRIVP
jgi:hypothetical protein